MAYTVKYGNRTATVDFKSPSTAVVTCGGTGLTCGTSANEIATAVQTAANNAAAVEQATVNQTRAIEDAQRILGGRSRIFGVRF